MDKLELDGRVARLERSVAILSVCNGLIFAAVAFAGVCLLSFRQASTVPATPMLAPPIEVSSGMVPSPVMTATTAVAGHDEGSVQHLAQKLQELFHLQNRGLLDNHEFESKKRELLDEPVESCNFAADLEAAGQLQKETIISSAEFAQLKKKILELVN